MSPRHVVTRQSRPAPRRRWEPIETPEPTAEDTSEAPAIPEDAEQLGYTTDTPEPLGNDVTTTPSEASPTGPRFDLNTYRTAPPASLAPDSIDLPPVFVETGEQPPETCSACWEKHPTEEVEVAGVKFLTCPNLPPGAQMVVTAHGDKFRGR